MFIEHSAFVGFSLIVLGLLLVAVLLILRKNRQIYNITIALSERDAKISHYRSDIEKITKSNELLENQVTALMATLDGLKIGSGNQSLENLINYLGNIDELLAEQIQSLETAEEFVSETIENVEAIVSETRYTIRRDRFARYRDALQSEAPTLSQYNEVLRADREFLQKFLGLLHSGRFNVSLGVEEFERVEKVLVALKDEEAKALIEELRETRIKSEAESYRRFKEKMEEVRKRLRDGELENPKLAKASVSPPKAID